jgi:hypothetical protein
VISPVDVHTAVLARASIVSIKRTKRTTMTEPRDHLGHEHMEDWLAVLSSQCNRIRNYVVSCATSLGTIKTSHPVFRINLEDQPVVGGVMERVMVVLVLDNVECFTTNVKLVVGKPKVDVHGSTRHPTHHDGPRRVKEALVPRNALATCVACSTGGQWTVACKGALHHCLAVHKRHRLDIASVTYSV